MAKPYIPPPLMYFEGIRPKTNAFCTSEYHWAKRLAHLGRLPTLLRFFTLSYLLALVPYPISGLFFHLKPRGTSLPPAGYLRDIDTRLALQSFRLRCSPPRVAAGRRPLGIRCSFRVLSLARYRPYWFSDPTLPLAISSAVWFFLAGPCWAHSATSTHSLRVSRSSRVTPT
jgi:hypothetical protein